MADAAVAERSPDPFTRIATATREDESTERPLLMTHTPRWVVHLSNSFLIVKSMTVDEPTLTTVLGLVSLAGSALFFALGAFARDIAGVRFWAIGCLAIGFATVLDGPRLISNWQWASLLFNIPFSIGQAYMFVGVLDFCMRFHGRQLLPALSVMAIVLTIAFTLVYPETTWRITTLSVYQATLNFATAWVLFRHGDAFSRRAFLAAATVALLQGLSALAQAGLVSTSSLQFDYGAPQLPIANTISWAGSLLSAVVGNSILMLLIMLRLVAELSAAAERDVLTGLLNRRGMRKKFDDLLAPHYESKDTIGVLLLDIDEFKKINDRYGHEVGDQVIATFGRVLLEMDVSKTSVSRWGGEEFCVVAEATTSRSLIELAESIRLQFVLSTAALPGLPHGCTVSIGAAMNHSPATLDVQGLLARADAQLYLAKRKGRNRVMMAASDHGGKDLTAAVQP